ncbi:hypothetical protein T492DRAFT_847402 [Pavlovales sp. CCMP2436]|nr:hypothetical protein T492DRAFT_847402 [Pavlovales sp. CCMP2436]
MVFVLIPAALSCSLVALSRPGTLGNVLLFRVSVFAASAAVAALTYESQSTVTALQPAAPAAPQKKQLIRRRSSLLEPENEHALVRATPNRSKLARSACAHQPASASVIIPAVPTCLHRCLWSAQTTRRSHPNKLPPGVAAYWDCAEIQSTKSSSRS